MNYRCKDKFCENFEKHMVVFNFGLQLCAYGSKEDVNGFSCKINEPCRDKTCLWDFLQGQTQTLLCIHRRWLEA